MGNIQSYVEMTTKNTKDYIELYIFFFVYFILFAPYIQLVYLIIESHWKDL